MAKKEYYLTPVSANYRAIKLELVGKAPEDRPYVALHLPGHGNVATIASRDLERFAVNILKALGSKKLKP